LQENIVEILGIRFQAVPEVIKIRVFAVNDVSDLNTLLKKAMTVSTINDLFDI